jgi:pimeloyl-ACP methyl ester carboxylesterase
MRLFSPWLERGHRPLGGLLRGLVRVLEPLADPAVSLYALTVPPGDRRLFADPAVRRMFQDDLLLGGRRQMQALLLDVVLFGRPWGFALGDVRTPVHLWYGSADNIVPLHHGEHLAERLPHAVLRIREDEGHLGGLGASREIFDTLLARWPDEDLPLLA